ncbi:hypothetical protein KIPB_002401 [Kipferlia bialata]|uniref:RING-type domain-containing protein n=1 Tax=Kipferlia bialata TaxID=797122 RepID=A0A9K3CRP9_9EUKA|nr:hypothetical protein KIPB_002401 [Kipferlia bialata]|eukprot:g2401.t1
MECPICLSSDDIPWLVTTCGHMYHNQCLEKGLISGRARCPICRERISLTTCVRAFPQLPSTVTAPPENVTFGQAGSTAEREREVRPQLSPIDPNQGELCLQDLDPSWIEEDRQARQRLHARRGGRGPSPSLTRAAPSPSPSASRSASSRVPTAADRPRGRGIRTYLETRRQERAAEAEAERARVATERLAAEARDRERDAAAAERERVVTERIASAVREVEQRHAEEEREAVAVREAERERESQVVADLERSLAAATEAENTRLQQAEEEARERREAAARVEAAARKRKREREAMMELLEMIGSGIGQTLGVVFGSAVVVAAWRRIGHK